MTRLSYEMGIGNSKYCVKTRQTTFFFLDIPRFHVYKFVSTVYNAKFKLYKKQKDGSWKYVLKYKTDCSPSCCDYSCIELVPEIISGKMTNPVGDYKMEVDCITCDQNIDSHTFFFTQKIGGVGYYVSDENGDPLEKAKGVVIDPVTGSTIESSYSDEYGRILFKTLVDNNSYDFEFSLSGYDKKKEKGKTITNESLYNIALKASGTGTLEAYTNNVYGYYFITDPNGVQLVGSGTTKKVWNNVITGEYSISYGAISGYTTPQDETKVLEDGKTITFYGEYIQNTGTIGVVTNLDDASFDILGPVNYKGSGKSWQVTNAPEGLYTIYWNSVAGYLIPDNDGEQAYLEAGKSIGFIGTYEVNCIIDAEYIINGILRNDYSYIDGTTEPNTKLTLYHSTESTTDPSRGEKVGTTTSDSNGNFSFKVNVGQICPKGSTCPDVIFQYFYVVLEDIKGTPVVGPYAFEQEEDKTTPGSVCYKGMSSVELFFVDASGFTDLYILGTGVDPYTCTSATKSAELSAAGWTLLSFIPLEKIVGYVGKVAPEIVAQLGERVVRSKIVDRIADKNVEQFIYEVSTRLKDLDVGYIDEERVKYINYLYLKTSEKVGVEGETYADYVITSLAKLSTSSDRAEIIRKLDAMYDRVIAQGWEGADDVMRIKKIVEAADTVDASKLDNLITDAPSPDLVRKDINDVVTEYVETPTENIYGIGNVKVRDLIRTSKAKKLTEKEAKDILQDQTLVGKMSKLKNYIDPITKDIKRHIEPFLPYIKKFLKVISDARYLGACAMVSWLISDNVEFMLSAPIEQSLKSGDCEHARELLEEYNSFKDNIIPIVNYACFPSVVSPVLLHFAEYIYDGKSKEFDYRIKNNCPSEIPKKYSSGTIYDVTVKSVIDGDTVKIDVKGTGKYSNYPDSLRITGVNAPEIEHKGIGIEEECYGEKAKERLKELLPVGTKIYIKLDISDDGSGHLRWLDEANNRLVGTIYAEEDVKDGTGKIVLKKDQDPMEIMLKEGYVEFYEPYGQGEHPSYDHDSYVAWACEGGETVSACKEILPEHAYRCSPLFMCREFDEPPLYPCCDPKKETCKSCSYGTKHGMWVDCAAGNAGYLKVKEKNGVACYIADYDTETKICDLPCTLIQLEGVEYAYLIFPDSSVADKYYPEFLAYTIDDVSKCTKSNPCSKTITLKKKPLPPVSLVVKNITTNSATIDWVKPDSISKYHVVVSPNVLDEYTTSTEYDITADLAPDTSYTVEVYSIDSVGNVSDPATTTFITDDKTPPKPEKGYLYITSIPSDADLYINGLKIPGYPTPISGLEYSPGTYGMKLKKDGYNDYDFGFITISANKNKVLSACLTPKTFALELKQTSKTTITIIWDDVCNVSYFEVYKDTKAYRVGGGNTQKKFSKLKTGYEYTFYIKAYDVSNNLLATSNTLCVKTNYGVCKVKDGYLTINTTPSGADIYVDGSDTGFSTNVKMTFGSGKKCGSVACEFGKHDFTLKLSGYDDYSFTETINSGDNKTKNITLVPVSGTGTLEAYTNNVYGYYFITDPNGVQLVGSGTTKKVWNNVITGEYSISYGAISGYTTPQDETKVLEDGKTITFYGEYKVIPKNGYLSIDSSIKGTWVYIDKVA